MELMCQGRARKNSRTRHEKVSRAWKRSKVVLLDGEKLLMPRSVSFSRGDFDDDLS
jgi:hypothetical protein